MTLKAKIICTFLAAVLVFSIALLSACSPNGDEITSYESSTGLLYELNDDGSAYVCTGIGTATDDNLVIGSSYNGLPVTGIGENAFAYNNSFHSIIIPESIKFIGKGAFEGCNSLTYTLLDGALYLGNNENKYYAFIKFANSGYSSEFVMNEGTGVMTSGVFEGCTELKKIVLSEKITQLDDYAFSGCSNLEVISFGQNSKLTSIGAGAFVNCSKLLSVAIPKGVTEIPAGMFSGCSSLVEITLPSLSSHLGYLFGKKNYANAVKTEDYYIPKTLKKANITSGDIPYKAFYNCNLIEKIKLDSVTSIGSSAFENCSSLESITIPDSVTSIGSSAFENCSSIESITIPNNVTTIDNYAFEGCTSLTSITIPNSVTSIYSYAFYGCSSLESITIPNSVTEIGCRAFYGCSTLKSITIPNSVTSIYSYAFYGCTNLTIYCEAESQPSGWDSDWNYSGCTVVWGHKQSE